MEYKGFRDLRVYQLSFQLALEVFEISKSFPKEERYGLATQMQRAAVSIASNIAEGFARQHTKEYQQFCYIALGSCAELETQLIIAQRRNYVSSEAFSELEDYLDHESRMLMNLIKSLRG